MFRPRLSLPGWAALFTAVVLVALLALAFFYSPDRGLRVEATAQPNQAAATPDTTVAPEDLPFDVEDIRSHLLDRPSTGSHTIDSQTTEALLYCDECISLGTALEIDGTPFQVALVTEPGTDTVFSAAVIGEQDGEPSLQLVVSGHDLTLTPGRGGTLVKQEKRYAPADEVCCPSGWSVQVYRFHDGRFEAGQRVSSAGEH